MTVHTHDPTEHRVSSRRGEGYLLRVFSQKLFLSLLGDLLTYLHTAAKNLLSEPGLKGGGEKGQASKLTDSVHPKSFKLIENAESHPPIV